MEDPEKQKPFLEKIDQKENHYARLVSFRPPITIALINTQPLICGREKTPDEVYNFLEIGDLTLHKRAVSRKHFMITYDNDVNTFFIEVLSRNGIILNGREEHDGKHPLTDGATISVQHFTMCFQIPEKFVPPTQFYGSKN